MRLARCVDPKGDNLRYGAVYEVSRVEEEYFVTKVMSGSLIRFFTKRFKDWQPEVGDVVLGQNLIKYVIAELDEKMFSNRKVGVKLVNPKTNESGWHTMPNRRELPAGISVLTCTVPEQVNPKASDGKEVRDLSHLDKTLGELLAEDSRRKLVAASAMAASGPVLKAPPVGPETDPAFLRDQEALGARNLKIKHLKERIARARMDSKAAYAELVVLVGKEEADKV